MGLDVSLSREKFISYDNFSTSVVEREIVYNSGITHNLGAMARESNLYYALWRPEEIGIEKASELIVLLTKGLLNLKQRPNYFKTYNSPNGWGMYEHFIPFVEKYLEACKEYPNSKIEIDR